jgi:hypothetical protein
MSGDSSKDGKPRKSFAAVSENCTVTIRVIAEESIDNQPSFKAGEERVNLLRALRQSDSRS